MHVPLPRRMQVLYNPNFRLYFGGQFVSLTGTWMQAVAQSWLVLRLTGSVAALGIVSFAQAAPSLVLALTGGVAADRWDRRRIMIVTQAAMMGIAFLTATLIAVDLLTFTLLVGMSVLLGVATAYDMPAQQALVPELVTPREIPQAIAMNQMIFNGSRLFGPAVAGVALAKLNLATVYAANGLSFVAVIASLLLIRLPQGHARGEARGTMLQSVREGLAYVRGSRLLCSLLPAMALAVLLVFPPMAVLAPGYVREELGQGPGTLGLLMAASGATSMVGAFGMMWIPVARRGLVMLACTVVMALAVSVLALVPSLVVVVIATSLLSLGFTLYMGLNAITIQQMVPNALRGRVSSVSGLTFTAAMPVGALAVSFAVAHVGFMVMYLLLAAVYVVLAGVLLLPSGILSYVPPAADEAHGPAPAGASAVPTPPGADRPGLRPVG